MKMWGLGLACSNISQWQEILALYVIPYQSFVEEILFDDWDTRLILANAEKRDPPFCFSLNIFGLLRRVFSYGITALGCSITFHFAFKKSSTTCVRLNDYDKAKIPHQKEPPMDIARSS
jgi:hypothetical protein